MMRENVFLGLAIGFLSCASFPANETLAWPDELSVARELIHGARFNGNYAVPEFPVSINGRKVYLELDTGTPHGFMLTNTKAEDFGLDVIRTVRELNADGSDRGANSYITVAAKLEILGINHVNVTGSVSDWRTFSSFPFEGTFSPELLGKCRIIIDYKNRLYAISDSVTPTVCFGNKYGEVQLLDIPERFGSNMYFSNDVDGEKSVTYLDTGASISFIDEDFVISKKIKYEVTGQKKVCPEVRFTLGDKTFSMKNVRMKKIARSVTFPQRINLTLGMDFLKGKVLVIDQVEERKIIVGEVD